MWFERFKKHKSGIVLISIFLLLIIGGWVGIMEYVSHELKLRKSDIQTQIKQSIGSPIDFSALKTKWSWGSVHVVLKDVILYENDALIPFLKIREFHLSAHVIRLLFKQDPIFNRIKVKGLEIVFGWHNDAFSILGLKGEPLKISTTHNPMDIPAMLATQDSVVIENSDIHLKSLGSEMTQRISGKFYWKDAKRYRVIFEGRHQLKINDSLYSSPGNITLGMDRSTHALSVKTGVGPVVGECQVAFQKTDEEKIEIEDKDHKAVKVVTENIDEDIKKRTRNGIQENSPPENNKTKLACIVSGRGIDIGTLYQQVQLKKEDPEWIQWLLTALEKGTISKFSIEMDGFLNKMDWKGTAYFQDLVFQYTAGWPKINEAKGKVTIEKEKVAVEIIRGKIVDTPLQSVRATIGPIGLKEVPTIVKIEGEINGQLEKGLEFLEKSPLQGTVGSLIIPLNPAGRMKLQLFLDIPLDEPTQTIKVNGKLAVNQAELKIKAIDLPVSNLTGTFFFTEAGVAANNISAISMGCPLVITATPEKITALGVVTANFLQKKLNIPYLKYLKGQSEISISYLNETAQWVVESNLKGMNIDLPAPLGKAEDVERLTSLVIDEAANNERKISANIKDVLSSNWVVAEKKDQYTIKRGHLSLGLKKADWPSSNTLLISGSINTLDVNAWWSFFKTLEDPTHPIPLQIQLLSKNLDVFGLIFQDTWVNYNIGNRGLKWILDGPAIQGSITLPTETNKQLQFHFDSLKIAKNTTGQSFEHTFLKGDEPLTAMIFYSKKLEIGDTPLGEWGFRLNPKSYGYDIEDLTIHNNATSLEANGQYRLEAGKKITVLQGKMLSDNIGETFTQWGFPSSIQGGKGRIQFDLTWLGSPIAFQLSAINGNADVRFRSGNILGVNTGIGKILGLLNFENLLQPRLPFKDVMKKGFGFDTLAGYFIFDKEQTQTDNLLIEGPVAKISLKGTAHLKTKGINLDMVVLPKVSGTLPLAAGLATGNPAVGLGIWALDKLTDSKMSGITQRSYHVTGTWDAPRLQEHGDTKGKRGRSPTKRKR